MRSRPRHPATAEARTSLRCDKNRSTGTTGRGSSPSTVHDSSPASRPAATRCTRMALPPGRRHREPRASITGNRDLHRQVVDVLYGPLKTSDNAVQHAVGGELALKGRLDIGELRGEVFAVARPTAGLRRRGRQLRRGTRPTSTRTLLRRARRVTRAVVLLPGPAPVRSVQADQPPTCPPCQCCSRQRQPLLPERPESVTERSLLSGALTL
jgi:hypothetical protein